MGKAIISNSSDMKKFDKNIKDKMLNIVQNNLENREYGINCPNCSEQISVLSGKNTCPFCRKEINVNLGINL